MYFINFSFPNGDLDLQTVFCWLKFDVKANKLNPRISGNSFCFNVINIWTNFDNNTRLVPYEPYYAAKEQT